MRNNTYVVTVYDSDYGFEASWECEGLQAGKSLAWAMGFDYGMGNVVLFRKSDGRRFSFQKPE